LSVGFASAGLSPVDVDSSVFEVSAGVFAGIFALVSSVKAAVLFSSVID
jgi:hypothetical protein